MDFTLLMIFICGVEIILFILFFNWVEGSPESQFYFSEVGLLKWMKENPRSTTIKAKDGTVFEVL